MSTPRHKLNQLRSLAAKAQVRNQLGQFAQRGASSEGGKQARTTLKVQALTHGIKTAFGDILPGAAIAEIVETIEAGGIATGINVLTTKLYDKVRNKSAAKVVAKKPLDAEKKSLFENLKTKIQTNGPEMAQKIVIKQALSIGFKVIAAVVIKDNPIGVAISAATLAAGLEPKIRQLLFRKKSKK